MPNCCFINFSFSQFHFFFSFSNFFLANRALIEFSTNGTDRVLRVEEGVPATFDCSEVVNTLSTEQLVAPESITTMWSVRIYDGDNIPGPVRPITDDDT